MGDEKKPPIKFSLEKPVKGTFLFDECLTGESKDRDGKDFTYHLYKFEDENKAEQVFFASKGLHEKLATVGSLRGRSFVITKVIAKDENGNIKEDKQGRAINEFRVEFVSAVEKAIEKEKEMDLNDIPF